MSAPDLSGGAVLPPDDNGFIYYAKDKYHSGFCADLPANQAAFLAVSQIPVAAKAFGAKMTQAAWKTKPTWAIVAGADKSINPVIERRMYQRSKSHTTEINGASHLVFMSHSKEVAAVIEEAAANAGR